MIGWLIAAAILVAPAASASQPPVHSPTGKWVVDNAPDQCLLSREYGSADHPLTIVFEKLPMTDRVNFYLLKQNGREDWDNGNAEIIPTGHDLTPRQFRAYTIGSVRKIDIQLNTDVIAEAARDGSLSIQIRGEANDSFAVPTLDAAFAALDNCALDLGRIWGVPADQQRLMAKPANPVESLRSLFSPDDYPRAAQLKGETGRTKVRLMIDETGAVTACALTRPSGSPTLDETACRLMLKRARFRPALDVHGKPISSVYVTSIEWLLG